MRVRKEEVRKLLGKQVYAMKKDRTVVAGKLVAIKGNRLIIRTKGGKVRTSAFIPLVLFDLLAIGTAPFAFGGFGPFGYGGLGYGGFGGFGGYPGFF